jgi:3-hydroxyisobutyrate dehydrogenase
MKVAFLGTGLIGEPMARRLLLAGHELAVWNRTPAKTSALAELGARVVATPRETIERCEVVCSMLRDGPVTREVLLGEGSWNHLRGRAVVQMATIGPSESRALAADVEAAAGEYLEAPVLGSVPQAREGSLQVLVGAPAERFERWKGLLAAFGPPRRIGEIGQAATVKLALNQLIPSLAAAFSLSLGMVKQSGTDIDAFLEVLRKSTFFAPTFDQKLPMMRSRDFSPTNFPAELMLKDVDLALAEARAQGLESRVLEGVRQVLEKTVARGAGRQDYSALSATIDPVG